MQVINTRHAWRPVLRPIGRMLVVAQLTIALQPLSVLAQENGQTPFNPQAQAQLQRLGALNQSIEQAKAKKAKEQQSPADQVSDKLVRVQELVANIKSLGSARAAGADSRTAQRLAELREHLEVIRAGTASVKAEFEVTRTELQRKKLPAEILARHDQAQAQFEQRAAQFGQIAAKTNDDEKVEELAQFFQQYPAQRKAATRDPRKLPWSTPKATTRQPAETKTGWYRNLYADQKVQLAQAAASPPSAACNSPTRPSPAKPRKTPTWPKPTKPA